MPRFQPKRLSSQDKQALFDELWELVASLKTREEVENFFRDLLSETEAVMLARRLQIAKRLLEGHSYSRIQQELHTSFVTIANVHHWLQSDQERYAHSLPKLEKEVRKRKKRRQTKTRNYEQPFSFRWLRKRYPLHFLLFNLLDDPFTSDK